MDPQEPTDVPIAEYPVDTAGPGRWQCPACHGWVSNAVPVHHCPQSQPSLRERIRRVSNG